MNIQPELIVVFIHVIISLFYVIFILSGVSNLRKEYIIPIIFVPIFGPLSAVVIDLLVASGENGRKRLNLDDDAFDDDILWKTLKNFHEKGDIVPLEEAILINDVKTRRRFMLETLYDDPLKYLDVLMIAKNNDDVETSHYATTSISYVQRSFQLSIQKFALATENNPNDLGLLDDYIGTLGNYIESGLLEEHLLKNLRVVYSKILNKKLAKIENDQMTLIEKLKNNIELKNYVSAFETSDLLKKYWPEDEQSWIESVRVCVDGYDRNRLQETLVEIQSQNINWTKLGKEQLALWMRDARAL